MLPVVLWWLTLQLFGLAALPLTWRVLRWLPDRGYALAKIVGLLLVSYLLWLGAISGVLVNNQGGIVFALLLVTGLSAMAAWRSGLSGLRERLSGWWREERAHVLAGELLFLLAFAGWAAVRAYAPEKIMPAGGEKYMEIAFLNGVLNSPRFPPLDPWLAGYGISYYYFGYVMMGVVTRLTGVLPTVGFDLYDALTFALTVSGAYGVTANLVRAAGGGRTGASARLSGLLGGVFVAVLGNLEGAIHALYSARLLPGSFIAWLAIPDLASEAQSGDLYPGHNWWWWRASRVLQDLDLQYQPVPYQPIDEFPFFSFLLGDNHPHKLALPFVLLAVALAFNALLAARAGLLAARPGREAIPAPGAPAGGWRGRAGRWRENRGLVGLYLFYALALGSLAFLNTWDFPIYLGLVVLACGLGLRMAGEQSMTRLLRKMFGLGALLGVGAVLLYLFFFLGFRSQAGGVLPYIFPPTRLAQYMVMFGPFLFILAVFLPRLARLSGSGRFPWRDTLRAWLWTAGLLYGLYLVVLVASAAALALVAQDSPLLAAIQPYTGGRAGLELIQAVLTARIADPWLFLALSALLAAAVSSGLRLSKPEAPAPLASERMGAEEPPATEALPASEGLPEAQAEHAPALFAALLAAAGLGLTLAVEFFYLRDNFGLRMNTIFKFYYQAWVLMAIAAAFGLWWLNRMLCPLPRALFGITTALLVAAGMVYPLMATFSRAEGFEGPPTLDAAATVAGKVPGHWAAHPDDWAAIQWLRANEPSNPVDLPILLEAPGTFQTQTGSYTHSSRFSAFTGFPTLLGWEGHEWQWRGSGEEINHRKPAIRDIYTTASPDQALEALRRWNVRYVIVGDVERQYVNRTCADPQTPCDPNAALEKFERSLTPVFRQGGTTVYAVPQ